MWNVESGMWNYGTACGDDIFYVGDGSRPDLTEFVANGMGNPSPTKMNER